MKNALLATVLATFAIGASLTLAQMSAFAANADNPYGNVDHRNDAGNDTGDSKIDGLNAQQLNQNYKGPLELRTPSQPIVLMPAQPDVVTVPPTTTAR